MFDIFSHATIFGKNTIILYLGDHDPSGLDMPRYIEDTLIKFSVPSFRVIRLGLTKEQIDKYGLPTNPTKRRDARARKYIEEHGKNSWELDALQPEVLSDILETGILKYLDKSSYDDIIRQEKKEKTELWELIDTINV